MKKIISILLTAVMLLGMSVMTSADYRGPYDGINMKPGLNPVVNILDGNRFEYIIYARDMDGMTNGDFVVSFSRGMKFVTLRETGNHDLCFWNDVGTQVKISFMYNEHNPEETVKMFILTFEYEGELTYPGLKVENLVGTYMKSVADVTVMEAATESPSTAPTNPDNSDKEPVSGSNNLLAGDVDFNDKVTAADARIVLRNSAKLEALSEIQFRSADVNEDGKITSADARLVLRIAAGLEK